MKRYDLIYSRRLRKAYYRFLVRFLGAISTFFTIKFKAASQHLKILTDRPFRPAQLRNPPKFPPITLVSSTKDALKALGNPDPSTKDIAEALKGADKVRGDGVLPQDPRTLKADERKAVEKAEVALGLHKSITKGTTEADLVQLEVEVDAIVEELAAKKEQLAEEKSAE